MPNQPIIFYYKRARQDDNTNREQDKRIRAMLTLIKNKEINYQAIEYVMVTTPVLKVNDPRIKNRLLNNIREYFVNSIKYSNNLILLVIEVLRIKILNTYKQVRDS